MPKTAYIGITGITSQAESESLIRVARHIGLPPDYRLMIGGLASYKGLVWDRVADPSQYVPVSELRSIFANDVTAFNVLHYNSRAKGLVAQVELLLDLVGSVEGIQLNLLWPDVKDLRRLRERYFVEVILQISFDASAQMSHNPSRIADKIAEYEGLIEYALIDLSGGTGTSFDFDYTQNLLEVLVQTNLDIGWGVAGGLGPNNMATLKPLLEIYPALSWDAQARLRTFSGQALDLAACEQYLLEGVEILHKLPGRGSTEVQN